MQSPRSLTSLKKTQILILPLARIKAGNSPVEEWVHSVLNGKYVLPVTSNALHAVPNLQRGWVPKVNFKAISLSSFSVLQSTLYTPLLLYSARCLLAAYTSLPHRAPARGHTPCLVSPLVFPAPSTVPNPGRREYTHVVLNYKSFVRNSADISQKKHMTNGSGSIMFPTSPQKFI